MVLVSGMIKHMFTDSVVIQIESGKGGDGIVHMHREKYRPRGGPDGGDGGKGGDVIFEVLPTLNVLNKFRNNELFKAADGKNGGPSNRTGKSGRDLVITVPPGTIIYNEETAELLADLTGPNQRFLAAKGGRGGRGNQHFASPRNQMPLTAERGEPAEAFTIRLDLKLVADVGLIGMPNAGKSSILAATTNARPKIDNYPFTTLEPNLGVVELDPDRTMVLADIPGLIEGASEGTGLGIDFLKHIQRTRVLIHVLDGWSEDVVRDYETINQEMEYFDERLAELPQIVVLNKVDLPDVAERLPDLQKVFKKKGVILLGVSAVARIQLRELLWKAWEELQRLPAETELESMPVYQAVVDPNAFEIEQEDEHTWRVSGKAIERAAAMTWWDQPGSVRMFQRKLTGMGIEKALRMAGIREGDSVVIGDWELEWQD